MGGRNHWLGLIAAVALTVCIAGCSLAQGSPDPNLEKQRAQARAELARWDAAVASAGGATDFVPVGELTGQIGDWEESVGSNNKPALMAGLVESSVTLPTDTPADGQIRWSDGTTSKVGVMSAQQAFAEMKSAASGSCDGCTPLKITGARLSSGQIETNRGRAEVPMWEFTIEGTAVRATRVAVVVSVSVVPPTWNPDDPPIGMSIISASGSANGTELMVTFTGAGGHSDKPCGSDYTAEAVESTSAIVIIVIEHRNETPVNCAGVAVERTAVAQLASPLGNRAVLEVLEGRPVTVTSTR